ncbi:NAD(P)-dependent dehydrogenase, short-chain alcohol dehydrogenase family [Cribrihabitans marinus]|uniref:NAD(P)-dependent dehydrogenase, short-chain alcohol dehydrogenase family n=1 Tax=Cribrihabitans marinus TaxID=1227549 RepID=A0A1H7D943_9RHOB|nr:SDR family oxidoreductase [Cribrihabitans marinus]GGH38159.1 short-chain dehydrogenase [Cribrihabitans marinus]SEJ98236.1 NAD(P)-dependent dehydrogenase, short-chain alcohol dehydrogenase family [Cribrihabitans marinus]
MIASLEGKVIIVTGAARGIGAATARQLAKSGAEGLVLVDRTPIETIPGLTVETVTADLIDRAAPELVIETALARFGRIDGLVNAAGLTTRAGFTDAQPVLWDRLMAVNARAPFFLMAGVIKDMLTRSAPGSIVNIQSMNAHCGAPDLAIYATTKGALQTMTKNAANAHLADRIRVNGINLGWVDTETERQLHEKDLGKGAGWLASQGAKLPLGRFVSEDEAARLAAYLLSDASAPMTGASIDLEQSVVGAPT